MENPIEQILILASQKGWLAVDKPCGISVHNDPGKDLISLLSERIHADLKLADRLEIKDPFTVAPVHRLDKETSGVILFATDNDCLGSLSQLFANDV